MQPWAVTFLLAFAGNAAAAAIGNVASTNEKLAARDLEDCRWIFDDCWCLDNGFPKKVDDSNCPART
ncbi:hypothetical protein HOO65_040759 [Ceratocystis lukuohia]|uniref:Uncharacterized protein n=1 Tax=Ceratocystis lukuohia TaxID=2019550 RepID=A0ABR4MJI1_9PEZI